MPHKVERLYSVVWEQGRLGEPRPSLDQIREHVQQSLRTLRQDHKRSLNPTPYKVNKLIHFAMFSLDKSYKTDCLLCVLCVDCGAKVGVSDDLYHFIHDLWLENAPIGELS